MALTGAGNGIGAETVPRFAAKGAKVIVTDIDLPAAERNSRLTAMRVGFQVILEVSSQLKSIKRCKSKNAYTTSK
jgi:NAD(P)-dependent dehydrogenase (short-subunit alcohol dehydrogenase family)